MRRSILGAVVAVAALTLVSAACDDVTPTPPPNPGPPPTTETFSGSLSVSGGVSFPFSTLAGGNISLTLNSTAPDAEATVGISIGAWNSASNSCSVSTGVFNDSAKAPVTLTGQVQSAGFNSVCARVYDVGKLTGTITFEITVVRP